MRGHARQAAGAALNVHLGTGLDFAVHTISTSRQPFVMVDLGAGVRLVCSDPETLAALAVVVCRAGQAMAAITDRRAAA